MRRDAFDDCRCGEQFTLTDKPADEYLTFFGHIADDMALLDDGTHVVMLRVDGKPLSLMDDHDPLRGTPPPSRHMRALADSNVTIYEHHVCHDRVEPFPLGQIPHRVLTRAGRGVSRRYSRRI